MAVSKEDKAAQRYISQQRRSKKAQATARKKQRAADRKSNIKRTAADFAGDAMVAVPLGVALGSLGAMGGAAAGLGAAATGARAGKLISKSKAAKKLLNRLRSKSPVKLTSKGKQRAKALMKDADDKMGLIGGAAGAAGGAKMVTDAIGGMSSKKRDRTKERENRRRRTSKMK